MSNPPTTMRILLNFLLFFFITSFPCFAGMVYQDFEDRNGTPHRDGIASLPPEYGWGFNGEVVQRSMEGQPVHGGGYSWAVTVPNGKRIHAGTAVVSSHQSYNMNFFPQCHDRLSFWIWSDPSEVGDHTVMVKLFDQGLYKDRGVGVWTRENQRARYRDWTRLEVYFSDFPSDFDLTQVHKIEFFNYWDGAYFYDDIELASSGSSEEDAQCLVNEKVAACRTDEQEGKASPKCVSVFGDRSEFVIDYMKMKVMGSDDQER